MIISVDYGTISGGGGSITDAVWTRAVDLRGSVDYTIDSSKVYLFGIGNNVGEKTVCKIENATLTTLSHTAGTYNATITYNGSNNLNVNYPSSAWSYINMFEITY